MRIGEPTRTNTGWVIRAVPLFKWPRWRVGLTSFLADMIALRKTLVLCPSCEGKMPKRWLDHYHYTLVRGFHADENACDRCREHGPANMYTSIQDWYGQQLLEERKCFEAMRARERARYDRDSKYLIANHG